jgi:transketolase|tara:strand:+ start:1777 stop:2391 length:615 start_codon:yes stop_codon:yes gene_type:complete
MVKKLEKRILEIAYKNKLSHITSYLTALPIIYNIYKNKKKEDIFILSSGHAALALYVVLEHFENQCAENLLKESGGHPHRNLKHGIHCSTGSLGMGITVAVGRALANKNRDYYVLLSDGECAEGSVWESLKSIKEKNLNNIHVYVNCNGYCAYNTVDVTYLEKRLKSFLPSINVIKTKVHSYNFLKGINGHYHIMNAENYNSIQ